MIYVFFCRKYFEFYYIRIVVQTCQNIYGLALHIGTFYYIHYCKLLSAKLTYTTLQSELTMQDVGTLIWYKHFCYSVGGCYVNFISIRTPFNEFFMSRPSHTKIDTDCKLLSQYKKRKFFM